MKYKRTIFKKDVKCTLAEKKKEEDNKVIVALDSYEWHELLSVLEHTLRFANKDSTRTRILLGKISTQLGNRTVTYE